MGRFKVVLELHLEVEADSADLAEEVAQNKAYEEFEFYDLYAIDEDLDLEREDVDQYEDL